MPQPDLFVGIDVAKDELVIHLHPAGPCWRVGNGKAGLAALSCKLARLANTAVVRLGFEAQGGYERGLAVVLDRLGLTVYLLDPARVRSFARFDRQSGKAHRQKRCSGGRPSVRRSSYLAALAIVRIGEGPLAATAKALRDAGKPFKLAIVATMRKLIVALNAMVKHGTPYRAD